jgi:hypothetical protein
LERRLKMKEVTKDQTFSGGCRTGEILVLVMARAAEGGANEEACG